MTQLTPDQVRRALEAAGEWDPNGVDTSAAPSEHRRTILSKLKIIVGASILLIVVAYAFTALTRGKENSQFDLHAPLPSGSISSPSGDLPMRKINTIAASAAVAFSALSFSPVAPQAQAQQAVQWRVEDGGNGHWYKLVISGPITWPQARAACELLGGHLVTPTSALENALVTSIGSRADHPSAWVNDFGGNAGGPWLGGYQPAGASPSQPWAWVSGEPWTWAGWAPGEPNGGYGPGVSITLMLGYANSNYYRGWADAGLIDFPPYPLSPSYIIEWSADCNGDGIVDYGQILSGQLADMNTNGIPDICEVDPCPGDINQNGSVDAVDLAMVLTSWGTSGGDYPRADMNHDGIVSGPDLGALLGGWGSCP